MQRMLFVGSQRQCAEVPLGGSLPRFLVEVSWGDGNGYFSILFNKIALQHLHRNLLTATHIPV